MSLKNQQGMTLIEILIAMAILAVLTLSTTSSLRTSTQLKKKVSSRINRQAKFRSALRLMDRDIRLAFNYRDITYQIYEDIKKREKEILANKKETEPEKTDPEAEPPTTPSKPPQPEEQEETTQVTLLNLEKYQRDTSDPTAFYGDKNELHFTNTNNVKISTDDMSSKQQEVGYFVKNCRNRIDPEKSYNCLWRRVSSVIDDRVEEGGKEFVVIENVKVFKLRYFGPTKADWVEQWFSGSRGDAETKDRFPSAVEISLAFEEDGKMEEAVMISYLAFPNNKAPSQEEQSQTQGLQ